jgi:heme ABC exporter ATP-binding subunit CcmA
MSAGSEAVLASEVWKFHGDFPALRGVSVSAARGSCLALLGRNGAGKTTLLRILAGLSAPSRGEVRILGTAPRLPVTRKRAGYLGHGIGIYDELTARENLLHFARLYGIAKRDAAVSNWLERVDLKRVEQGRVREFSRGMRQRLAIARAFVHDPEVLLLDEPFTSLDDRAIALLQSLLRDALARGCTAVLSTHQLREALELATHVALLDRGKLKFAGLRTQAMLDMPPSVYSEVEHTG